MAENSNNNPIEAVAVTITDEKKNDNKEENKLEPKKKRSFGSFHVRKLMLTVTIFTFILSIPLLFTAIWLLYIEQYDCEGLLKALPMSQTGIAIALIFVFFISNGVVYSGARFPAPGLIAVVVPLVVLFIIGLSLSGSFKTETQRIPGSPQWLKIRVHSDYHWKNIKSCLYDTMVCMELISRSYNLKAYEFTTSKLSPIESGCCQPPSSCGMDYVNATYWAKRDKVLEIEIDMPQNRDCDLWKNNETNLCYDCYACKEGYIKILEGKWLKLGTFLIAISLLMMISHLLLFVIMMSEENVP